MSEIKSGKGVCPEAGWQPEPTFKQITRTGRKVLRAEALARGRGRARLLPAGKAPLKGPASPLPKERGAVRGGLRLFWPGIQLQLVRSQPTCPSSTGPRPGPADPEGRKGGSACPAQSGPRPPRAWEAPSGFLQETSCSRPSPGQRGTFLSTGLRPELELTGGRRGSAPFQPGC